MYYQFLRFVNVLSVLMLVGTGGLLAFRFPLLRVAAVVIVVLCIYYGRGPGRSTAYGSAAFAQPGDIPAEMEDGPGLNVGTLIAPKPGRIEAIRAQFSRSLPADRAVAMLAASNMRNPPLPEVRLNRAVHTCVFAPTGAGKGVSLVIPYLLSCRDSALILDVKGDNFRLTSEHRARVFGHKIFAIDPFLTASPVSDSLNVLALIDASDPDALDDVRAVVTNFGEAEDRPGADPHWAKGGQDAITLAVGSVVAGAPEGARNLQTARDILSDRARFLEVARAASTSPVFDGKLARIARQFLGMSEKELGSFLSVANRGMAVLDSPAIARVTTSSTFAPAELLTGDASLYVILAPDKIKSHGEIFRLVLGACVRACVKNGLQEEKLLRLILDESASLGQMPEIESIVQVLRGYGARATFFFQGVAQLSKVVPPGQESLMLSNTTQIYFGINDHDTLKTLSETLGKHTLSIRSNNTGWSRTDQAGGEGGGSYTRSGGESWSLAGRELRMMDEIRVGDPREAITLAPGTPPIRTRLGRYYERNTGRIGPARCATETACLFIVALLLTAFGAEVSRQEFDHGQVQRAREGGRLPQGGPRQGVGRDEGPGDGREPRTRRRPVPR